MRDPFKIAGPAVISFSGGRTSGYMVRRILDAHGGKLPANVLVKFTNTGKERPQTLDFVDRCSREWDVPIVWLEYRYDNGPQFAVVDYASASRNGEPFEAAITSRGGDSGFLPNPRVRYCTIELKILTTIRWLVSLSWTEWTNAIGFRADEPLRVAKLNAAIRDDREECVAPCAEAGVSR
jgi:3'-phosphoadenosine 5'-phosphosulfate sulfotransferase (PAPS reductase)/FAD synthetase